MIAAARLQLVMAEARDGSGRRGAVAHAVAHGGVVAKCESGWVRVVALESDLRGWQLIVLPMHAGWASVPRTPGTTPYAAPRERRR
jgi:hypothetical protein